MAQSSDQQQSKGFESALAELQAIVKKMESGELSLEDSLKAFEQGVRLTRQCAEELSAAERKVELLMNPQATDAPKLAPFSAEV
jgi:exodeoxyribonuclease VII small subunit